MNEFKLERMQHDRQAFYEFMKSAPVRDLVSGHADEIAASAGSGYVSSVWDAQTRAVGNVRAESWRAMWDNARNHTLEREIGRRSR